MNSEDGPNETFVKTMDDAPDQSAPCALPCYPWDYIVSIQHIGYSKFLCTSSLRFAGTGAGPLEDGEAPRRWQLCFIREGTSRIHLGVLHYILSDVEE